MPKEVSIKIFVITFILISWIIIPMVFGKLGSQFNDGKASGSAIKAEHILYGTPLLVIHLQLLFNSMIQHSYVPTAFLKGVITPIVKDAEGDLSSPDNHSRRVNERPYEAEPGTNCNKRFFDGNGLYYKWYFQSRKVAPKFSLGRAPKGLPKYPWGPMRGKFQKKIL